VSTVYSHRFVAGQYPAGSQAIYTVPAGLVAVIKDIVVSVTGSGLTTFQLWVPGAPLLQLVSLAPNAYNHWNGHQVASEGEALQLITSGGPVLLSVSGFLLSLP